MADVHTVLDTAKNDAQTAVTALEHVCLGTVLDDAKQVIHDGVELIRERLSALIHGAPAPAEPADTPPAS